jgi:polyhydroxybutyrate depolymerase
MKKLLFCIVMVTSLSASSQLIADSVLIDSHYRTYSYNPPAMQSSKASLMFIMHGSGGSSDNMIGISKNLAAIAGKENLILVYPNGFGRYWNECRKFSTAVANKEDINEQAFFTAMIKHFYALYKIDTNRVFASGMSGGGHMAYKLGMTMPGKIKAIAAVVANLPDSASCDCTASGKALPVLIINGTADGVNPYNGGEMFVNNSSFGVVRSSEGSFQYWANLAGYKGEPEIQLLPDNDPNDQKRIEAYTYQQKKHPTVQLLKVIGGKHDYPNDIDTYVYIWNFFKAVR